jgi:3-oxoacyl-[acyl-carrier-protein] synthase-3
MVQVNKIKAAVTGIQGYVPDTVLSNLDLEKMVDTTDEWITTRTGIKERRILKEPGKALSDMCVEAVNGLLKKTSTKPEDIELLICATVTPDMVFPDTANIILDKVGAKNAYGYDIRAACSGFLFSLFTASKLIESGAYKKVIVVGGDQMSSIIDYTDRATCVIFGDGCGAVLLEPCDDGTGIIDAVLKSDGAGRHHLHMKAGGSLKPASIETVMAKEHFVYQEGQAVFKYAVKGMVSAIEDVLARNEMVTKNIDWLVPHQANKRIISSVGEFLGMPPEKVMVNIEKYGNTTSGTIPLCLWEWESKLKKGDNLMLTAFGGGFTWGALLLKWSYDGENGNS